MRNEILNFLISLVPFEKQKIKLKNKCLNKNLQKKYHGLHPASNGASMYEFADWIKEWSSLQVKNVFEIGANYAQDSEALMARFDLKPKDIWVFEAHPDLYTKITQLHKFNAFHYAIYNEQKAIDINICPADAENTGISSIRENRLHHLENKVSVQAIRMDNFMKEHKIDKIDFLKLDVEGCNFEALQGFGDRLKDVNSIHIEAEHTALWQGQKLYNDIAKILEGNDFQLIKFQRYASQSDSFWVQTKYLRAD